MLFLLNQMPETVDLTGDDGFKVVMIITTPLFGVLCV